MAEQLENYILLYNKSNKTSISDFIEANHIYSIEPQELFDLNKEFIWQQYTEFDKEAEKSKTGKWPESADDLNVNSYLPASCVLKVDPNRITAEVVISQTNLQVNENDFCAFASDKIQDILQNEGYVLSNSSKQSPDCTVIGWFKTLRHIMSPISGGRYRLLNSKKGFEEFSDLSSYIISLATSVTKNGGSFSLRLPIIEAGVNETYYNNKGEVEGSFMTPFKSDYHKNYRREGSPYFSKASFYDVESNFFSWLINSNDILFISFEKLEMEGKNQYQDESRTNELKLSDGVFDMIGLVDEVKVVTNAPSSTAYVEVIGRDLMKLIIEDGSFFFNTSTVAYPSMVFANTAPRTDKKNVENITVRDVARSGVLGNVGQQGDYSNILEAWNFEDTVKRLRWPSGEVDIFANRINMSIEYILKGVISKLANIEIAPSHVFESWGADRTTFQELLPKEDK